LRSLGGCRGRSLGGGGLGGAARLAVAHGDSFTRKFR
jgi:hypothetical protein